MRNKFASVPEAVALVLDADTFCLGGFASHGAPEALLKGLAQRFLDTGHPKGLERFRRSARSVNVVVNYDGFELDEDLGDAWADIAKSLSEKHYRNVSRYTTSAFMRMKLGQALDGRGVKPHLYETQREAMDFAKQWRTAQT